MKYLKYNLEEVLRKIKACRYIFLFLDYDGTLVEFKDNPEQAIPPDKVKNLISELSLKDNIITTIVSGRTIHNLLEFFKGIETQKINWIGIHGAQVKYKDCDIALSDDARESLPYIRNLKSQILKMTDGIPCFYLEDKKISLALHYRKCKEKDMLHMPAVVDLIDNFIRNKPLDYLKMKKVLEVKPGNINKGNSLKIIGEKYKSLVPSINICIGDDLTDEYLFRANEDGINIKVGNDNLKKINAEYYLKNVNDTYYFLGRMVNLS